MRKLSQLVLTLILFISLQTTTKAQTTLAAGDLAFSGYVSGGNGTTISDRFSFVLLKAVTANTVIKFTDYGWRTDLNAFSSGVSLESEYTLTISSALPAGTEIHITNNNITGNPAPTATLVGGGSAGTVVASTGAGFLAGNMAFSTTGDQIFAYQNTFASPTFIAGLHMNAYNTLNGDPSTTSAATWDGVIASGSLNTNSSGLPAGLTTGTNALWIGSVNGVSPFTTEFDNAFFACGPNVSTVALARTALNTAANWTVSDGAPAFTLPTGCNYLGVLSAPTFTTNPSNAAICEGANTSFTVAATGASSYQWQVDNGGGFANITDNATYSGSTTVTLSITAAPASFNGYLYRCVATNGTGSTNSTSATLTVTALPTNPTLLAKTPNTATVADGTPVSATFNAGSGGSGCTDDFRYTTNGGASYLPYTPGSNISTTGLAAGTGVVTIEGRRAGCASCSGNYVALATWIVTPLPAAATTLNAGDIAFSGYISNAVTDEFSFVLLRNIGPGTIVNFTDNGWLSTNVFATGEQTVTWTSNAAYAAGTEIKISGLTATLASGGSAGTVTGTALSLSTSGDQILAYRGTAAAPTFISAIHMNVFAVSNGDPVTTTAAAWDGTATGTSASALPTGLTTGTNAIWIGVQGDVASEFENARYGTCSNPATLGAISTLRAALNNQANWTKTNGTPPGFTLPTGCPYLGLGTPPNFTTNPANATVCENATATFTVVAGGATSYQWQEDAGSGFANITDNATFSGTLTATLTINATPISFNGRSYRCVATNGSGSSTSTGATLTVNGLPVGPTLLAKTPAGLIVADGTPVSATFNAGSGGTGCSDDFRYTTDGGATYLPYTPGSNISTTGLAAGSGHVFIEGRRANCSAGCQGNYTVLAHWVVTPLPVGATTLNAGDIAFSGYTSTSAGDDFSFVLLRNVGPGTQINFTDNGWLSTNALQTAEQTITWTAPAGGLTAGVEIKISGLTATRSGAGAAGTVTGTPLSLSSSGDQILAYRGTAASPTFISAIHMNVYSTANGDPSTTTAAAWDGTANTQSSSALPTGLTTGTNCIWIGTQGVISSEHNNAKYGLCNLPEVAGSITALRAALNNQANWTVDDNTPPAFTLPTGCNYLGVLCPTITVTNPGTSTGTAGTAFSQTFTATGGSPAYTFTTASTLPTGLTLSAAGVLSGTPTQSGTFPIIVTATDANGCSGNGATYNLVIGCPANSATATPASQTICSGAAITNIVLSGGLATTTYNWTRDNAGSVTGIAASGSGDISGSLTNTTNAPVTVTFTVTPVIYGCNGTPTTATVLVNPAPDAVATPSSQSTCSGANITTIVLSGSVSGTTFNWTRDNTGTVTGIAGSGSGDISGALTNTTNAPITVTFTITPSTVNCTGVPITATVVVNPTPTVTATPASQSRCSGANIQPILMSGTVGATSFDWVRDNVGTIGGSIPASGSGNITGNLVNNTGAPVTVTFTITPNANGCAGTPVTATITVNPLPLAIINGGGAWVCQNTNYQLTATPDPGYTYQWGISLFTNPFTNLGTAQTQPITQSGNYLLTVTNQYGCIDTAMNTVLVSDYRFDGSLATGDPVQTGRINRFATISTCAAPKTCPGLFTTTGSRLYDAYTIVNPRNVPVCARIGITSFCGTNIFCAAYLGSFNPASPCTNYLADPGSSFTFSGFYEATIPANGTMVVVVHEVNPGTGCANYRLTVDIPRDNFITVTPNDTVCAGTPVTLTAPPANNYSWIPGGATTQSITPSLVLGDNIYSVSSGYGNFGCSATLKDTIVVNPTPTADAVANQYFCANSATTPITLTSSTPGATFSWTNSNPSIGLAASGTGDIPSFTATNATAGPISGTITVTPTVGTCVGTPITFTITIANQPSITSVTEDSVCAPGGTVNLAATGTGVINWFDALTGGTLLNTGPTYTPNVTSTTTFYVESQVTSPASQTLNMPGQSNTFPGNIRGYWFTAPVDFVITSLLVPTTASSGPQNIAVVKFNGNVPPPVFSATTNAFTTVFLSRQNPSIGKIPCNIQVRAGEVIGILGSRGGINSYAPGDYATTIFGHPVQLERLGMQFPLETTNPQNLWREFGATTSISRVVFEYANVSCSSSPRVPVTGTVLPKPLVTATPATQTVCSGPITTIALTSNVPGTTYSWTRDNLGNVTGIGATGTGDISGTLTNNTTVPQTVTFTIIGTSPDGCLSDPVTATVNVQAVPTITCPGNITVNNALNQCGNTVTYTTTQTGIPVPTLSYTFTGATTGSGSGSGSGSFFNVGTTTVTVTATNACGSANCSFTVTVVDAQPPSITCPAPLTVSCELAVPGPNELLVTASDNCPGVLVTFRGDVISNQTCADRYTITRTYRATDAAGNFTECTQVITVNDQTPPVMTCPAPLTVSCASAVPNPNIALVTGVSDNCTGPVAVTWQGDAISNQTCANRYTITRTYRATDVCGNFAECTQIITVNDQTPPVVTCPAPLTVSCASAVPAPNTALVTATDNCAGAITITHVSDVISNQTCANRYTITRTYRATDVCGNFAQCTQIITVNDQTPPVVTCPAPVTVSCASAVPAPNTALVTATDNCGGTITITHIGDVITNQTCPNRFTLTRTYRATDVCGNFAECTQVITVNDNTAPVITCPAPITVTTPFGSCVAVVNFAATATDNCGGAITFTYSHAPGSSFPIGTTTVTATATDACGNSSSCTFNITVIDAQAPVITQQPQTRTVCVGQNATFTVAAITSPTAGGPLSYQWQQWNGTAWVNIAGATGTSHTVNSVTLAMNTNTFRVVVTGLCTVVNSNPASLYVNPLPTIALTASPLASLLPNQTTSITATVNPPGGTFVWALNGTPITGVTGPVLSPINVNGIGTYTAVYTDPRGCVSATASIDITAQASSILWVYPNPNTGTFNVRFYNQTGEQVTLKVFNALGQVVFSQSLPLGVAYSNIVVNLNNVPAGVYIVKIMNGSGAELAAKRIVVYHP